MAPWWMTTQIGAVAVVLALFGYAWHVTLGGRFPLAARVAAPIVLAAMGVALALNLELAYWSFVIALAPLVGWQLGARDGGFPLRPQFVLGASYAAAASGLVLAWPHVDAYPLVLVLLAAVFLRIAFLDSILAWLRARSTARDRREEND